MKSVKAIAFEFQVIVL